MMLVIYNNVETLIECPEFYLFFYSDQPGWVFHLVQQVMDDGLANMLLGRKCYPFFPDNIKHQTAVVFHFYFER